MERLENRTFLSTVTVDTLADTSAIDSLTSPLDSAGHISLRSAIENYDNQLRGNNEDTTINFALGAGNPTLNIGSSGLGPLPSLLGNINGFALIIDGKTGGATRVELNGMMAGSFANGLTIAGNQITLRSLVINRFGANGVDITGTPPPGDGFAVVRDCYLGTDSAGKKALGNGGDGILIEGGTPGNLIGSSSAAAGNVISGNAGNGIHIKARNPFGPPPDSNTFGNTVIGNFIGTNAAGTAALGNGGNGVLIEGDPAASTQLTRPDVIGDPARRGNVISGNAGDGLLIQGFFAPLSGTNNNLVQGNLIGTNATGTAAIANRLNGVALSGTPNNLIGGLGGSGGNLISGNFLDGIDVEGQSSDANQIKSNSIGLTLDGTGALPNLGDAVLDNNAPNTQIGSLVPGEGNKMAGTTNGITAQGSLARGLTIDGNFIGRDGLGAKFSSGLRMVGTGPEIFVEGNAFFNVLNTNIDAFFEADGKYTFSGNSFLRGKVVPSGIFGAKLSVADNLTASIVYDNNTDIRDATGLQATEGAGGSVNWAISNNMQKLGDNGLRLALSTNGIVSLNNNHWEQDTKVDANVSTNLAPGTFLTLQMTGEAYLNGGAKGLAVNANVGANATLIQDIASLTSSGNRDDGVNIVVLASLGAKARTSMKGWDVEGNTGFGVGLRKASTVLGVEWNFTDGLLRGNRKGGFLLYLDPLSVIRNTKVLGNGGSGATVAGNGDPEFTGCTFSGNTNGIELMDSSVATIDGSNMISGNSGAGILVENTARAIIQGNTITGNGKGVMVTDSGRATVEDNSIFGDAGLGIDLAGDGNGLQNFPVITSAVTGAGGTAIGGTLSSKPGQKYTLRFFSNVTPNPSGFGEGQTFLGVTSVTTDGSGNATFSFQPASPVGAGMFIAATATDSLGDTSEFSRDVAVRSTTSKAAITGLVFNDRNASGTQNKGDLPLANVKVFIGAKHTGVFVPGDLLTTTDASGVFTFTKLAPGTYTFTTQPPAGFHQDFPFGGREYTAMVSAGAVASGYKFGETTGSHVSGTIYLNAAGKLTSLAGVHVTITAANGKGPVYTRISNSDGYYGIGGLPNTSYIVTVQLPTGYVIASGTLSQTTPLLKSGQNDDNVNFTFKPAQAAAFRRRTALFSSQIFRRF